MTNIWNKIKTWHYKMRHESILTEMYFEQMGYESEITFNDWMRINNVITWPERKAQLIKNGKIKENNTKYDKQKLVAKKISDISTSVGSLIKNDKNFVRRILGKVATIPKPGASPKNK